MPLKEYQREVVEEFDRWFGMLKKERRRAAGAEATVKKMERGGFEEAEIEPVRRDAEANLASVWRDYHGSAAGLEWHDRRDPGGRPIPHVCIQVPTGGGKTRIAAAILKRIGSGRGLVLWMVPSKTIKKQTIAILKDKKHPIRQLLDSASGGRVEVVKKDERVTKSMLLDSLCIMPLTQQSANRVDNDFLKMQRDGGLYAEFFPDTDERGKIAGLNADNPGLDMIDGTDMPRKSLVNVFRMVRPIIILDESHKASAKNFGKWAEHVNRLGPRLVVELSATPNQAESNVLHIVSGRVLRDESMIKRQIQVTTSSLNWQGTLKRSVDRLLELDAAARKHDRYIRPIMVIRVERTGRDKRDGVFVHAYDARDYLVRTLGIPPEQVAIKTSDDDDLQDKDLMNSDTTIRYIITKNALMEGWDCPFAYMLVILDGMKSRIALTQLLGRIMRQPYTEFTDVESLDSCYVDCLDNDIEKLVVLIQNRLEHEGITGVYVSNTDGGEPEEGRPINKRRPQFEKLDIRLPTVLHRDGRKWVDIDYDMHILHGIDWNGIAVGLPAGAMQGTHSPRPDTVKISTEDGWCDYMREARGASGRPDLAEWVSMVGELVPNAWQAARIIRSFWQDTKMTESEILSNEAELLDLLLRGLKTKVMDKAEGVFRAKLDSKTIRFDMHAPTGVFRMKGEYEALRDDYRLLTKKRRRVRMSLFEPVCHEDFTTDTERKFARYLDDAKAIEWWHRVAARGRGEYYLRGWNEHKIYPDFIAVFSSKNERVLRIYETKGRNLDNPDTAYKKKVLGLLGDVLNAGNLKVTGGSLKGNFKIVFDDDVDKEYRTGLAAGPSAEATNLLPV